jgi:hypothetical protein
MKAAALISFAVVLVMASPAFGQSPPPRIAVQLAYSRTLGVDCPELDRTLRDALAVQFGYDPVQVEATARLSVSLTRQGPDTRAEMVLYDGNGSALWGDHVQSHGDCVRLLSSAAVMIRIGIDPLVLPVSRVPAPSPSEWRGRAGLGVAVALGIAPAAAVGFSLQAGARWRWLSLALEGRADLPASRSSLGISTSLLAATFLPCGHYALWVLDGFLCGLVTAGPRRAATLDGTEHGSAWYVGAGTRLGLELPFASRFAGFVSGDIVGAVQPTVVRVHGVERWTTPSLAGGFGLGVLAVF